MKHEQNFIIIPAYAPDDRLLSLVEELAGYGEAEIIIVDDGSGAEYQSLFREVSDHATVLIQKRNRGKGRAIKTALGYILENRPSAKTIVTADADGQHLPVDIFRILSAARQQDRKFVLGTRRFFGKVPLRSRIGNNVTCFVFFCAAGIWLHDTQTGLRAFDIRFVAPLLHVKGERYEYEMNVLMQLAEQNVCFEEIPIETVYFEHNKSSHFCIVRDSLRIYGSIFKFMGSSVVSFIVDYLLFLTFCTGLGYIKIEKFWIVPVSNVLARIISAGCNFYLNRKYVFQHKGNAVRAAVRYTVLAAWILVINTVLLSWITRQEYLGAAAAKLCTESAIGIFSFFMQRFFVFRVRRNIL